ncbi:monovalent cation/H(+) antiporter subunit G [Thiohalorhabdus methylotrophus]|uniref:Monovalent cation/H(+) antiporter subunit G n=1 Tax=Thiohalorhabdus methylotrophus TaxID=3242694 RepID=A0ABV4TQL1_9GAMM
MALLTDAASWLCIVLGGLFVLIGGIGVLRLPDFFTRLHAAGVTDTLGAGLVILGLAFQAGLTLTTVKLALIYGFFILTSPTAAHALAKAALHGGVKPKVDGRPPS